MTRSARGITSMLQKRPKKLTDMILHRVGLTLKQGKTHCGRELITDPIAHRPIVRDVDADL